MQRVVFLVEAENKQIPCMLNPESVSIYRQAGYREKRSIGGALGGVPQSEYSLLFTGGGSTFMELELLFDVTLMPSNNGINDVRQLTSDFFKLTEIPPNGKTSNQLPTIRMIWGKSWNISAVVTDVAERLDYFTRDGVPRRSWLKIRLRKVNHEHSFEPSTSSRKKRLIQQVLDQAEELREKHASLESKGKTADMQTIITSERLDVIAQQYYQDPSLWKLLAVFSKVKRPMALFSRRTIKIPSLNELKKMISL